MALVYSMKPIGKTEPERDMVFMFKEKAPFKINCGSGVFRIFVKRIEVHPDGYYYGGTVSDCDVEGFYNPAEKRGTIIFLQKEKAVVLQ